MIKKITKEWGLVAIFTIAVGLVCQYADSHDPPPPIWQSGPTELTIPALTIVDSAGTQIAPTAAVGDFSGPASSTDTAIVRFSGTGGKTGQNSNVTIDATDNLVMPSGSSLSLPLENDQATPTLNFGDGDTGFFESADDNLRITIAGTSRYFFQGNAFLSIVAGGPSFLNRSSTMTVPVFINERSDTTTGIGGLAGTLSLITGSVEALSVDASQNVVVKDVVGRDGSGVDSAGTDLNFEGGTATGNAAGGDILFKTSTAGSSGTVTQGQSTQMTIKANNAGVVLENGIAFQIKNANGNAFDLCPYPTSTEADETARSITTADHCKLIYSSTAVTITWTLPEADTASNVGMVVFLQKNTTTASGVTIAPQSGDKINNEVDFSGEFLADKQTIRCVLIDSTFQWMCDQLSVGM